MKQFIIKYKFKNGTPEEWHRQIAEFIAALDTDPDLKGKISYRVMKEKQGAGYYHLATVNDDNVPNVLQTKDFFKRYTEATKHTGGGEVEVQPLETVASTAFKL
jgi:hypothetical protein